MCLTAKTAVYPPFVYLLYGFSRSVEYLRGLLVGGEMPDRPPLVGRREFANGQACQTTASRTWPS